MLKIKIIGDPFNHLSKIELVLRLGLYILIGAILASFIFYLLFLYQRFYLTLTQAEEIIILKSQLAVNDLDIALFKEIQAKEERRTAERKIDWSKVYNPFGKQEP
jgi:hypothetical protein